jgi:hypothetical protein
VAFADEPELDVEAGANPSSSATTNQPVAIQVNVTQKKDNVWKIVSIVLVLVIILGAAMGLILGLRAMMTPAPAPAPVPEVTWTANVLANPSFSTIDFVTGKARNWLGNYDLIIFSPTAKRDVNGQMSEQAPPPNNGNQPPNSSSGNQPCSIPAIGPIPLNAVDAWPGCAWDYITRDYFAQTPRLLPPTGGTVALHLFVNGSKSVMENGVALQTIVPDPHPAGTLISLNVTASVFTEFTLTSVYQNNQGNEQDPSVELTVFVKYVDLVVADTYNIRASPRANGWNTIGQEISLRSDGRVESVKIQMFQSYLGHSFWSYVSMQSLQRKTTA